MSIQTTAIDYGMAISFIDGTRGAQVLIFDGYFQVPVLTQGKAVVLGHWYQIYQVGNRYHLGPEVSGRP